MPGLNRTAVPGVIHQAEIPWAYMHHTGNGDFNDGAIGRLFQQL